MIVLNTIDCVKGMNFIKYDLYLLQLNFCFKWATLQAKLSNASLQNELSEEFALVIITAKWGKDTVDQVVKHLSCVPNTLPTNLQARIASSYSDIDKELFLTVTQQLDKYCSELFSALSPRSEAETYVLTPPVRHCLTCVTNTDKPYKLGVHN